MTIMSRLQKNANYAITVANKPIYLSSPHILCFQVVSLLVQYTGPDSSRRGRGGEDEQEEADCNCNTNSSKTSTVFLFVFMFVFVLLKVMMKNTKITIFREKKFTQMKTYILS